MSQDLIKSLMVGRGYMNMHTNGLTEEQLLAIPEGMESNILWHLGHLYNSHCGMLYPHCDAENPCPAAYQDMFKGGSKPADWAEAPNVQEIVDNFNGVAKQIADDYAAGAFANYQSWDLMPGMSIENPEDAIGFIIVHESVHHGNIIVMRRLLGIS